MDSARVRRIRELGARGQILRREREARKNKISCPIKNIMLNVMATLKHTKHTVVQTIHEPELVKNYYNRFTHVTDRIGNRVNRWVWLRPDRPFMSNRHT